MPRDCLIKNANWCGMPLNTYTDQEGCWKAVERCYSQSQTCWQSAPPSGNANCKVWQDYCKQAEADCTATKFEGPPEFAGEEKMAKVPGEVPKPWNNVFEGGGRSSGEDTSAVTTTAHTGTTLEDSVPTPTTAITPTVMSPLPTSLSSTAPQSSTTRSANPPAPLPVSEDGRCGGDTGRVCRGSSYGDCCSSKGQCGRSTRHCGCGCQTEFGVCYK